MTDIPQDLVARVQERLNEAGLESYGLKVRCLGRKVTLQGIVDVLAEKATAEEVASRTPGVTGVENAITVCVDGEIDDADVAFEVAEELTADPLCLGVGAEVSGGRVRLVGQVPTAATATRAIATASRARGVREVASELTLAPDAATDDPSLVNAIETALVDFLGGAEARRVETTARNGIVTLTGQTGSEAAARAEQIAAATPGVRGVRNLLRTAADLSGRVVAYLEAQVRADPLLRKSVLSFAVHEGRLVAEGEVSDLEAKRGLERILRRAWEKSRPDIRGIDNRVRMPR